MEGLSTVRFPVTRDTTVGMRVGTMEFPELMMSTGPTGTWRNISVSSISTKRCRASAPPCTEASRFLRMLAAPSTAGTKDSSVSMSAGE